MALQDELRAGREGPLDPLAAAAAGKLGPRRRRRWDLVLAWTAILGPALALGCWLAVRQQVGDLEARVVRDTSELFSRSNARPVHGDAPSPGAIGDAVPRHLPPLEAAAKALAKDEAGTRRARDVVSGEAPIDALPDSFAAALDRLGPDVDALLAATRAERADFPVTKESFSPLDDGGWLGWQLAATLAGVRMRRALAAGEPASALRDGLDGLALGRDAAIARFLVGRMVGAAVVSRLSPAVAAAVDALPDAVARRDALRRLRAIRDAFPPFSRTLADDFTLMQLYAGEALPRSVRDALHPRARAIVEGASRKTAMWERLAIRDGWRGLREVEDLLVAAADRPEPERAAVAAAVKARVLRSPNPFAAIALPDFGKYARRADASNRRLDGLVLAAAAGAFQAERRRWPESVTEIVATGDLDRSEAARLAGATPLWDWIGDEPATVFSY